MAPGSTSPAMCLGWGLPWAQGHGDRPSSATGCLANQPERSHLSQAPTPHLRRGPVTVLGGRWRGQGMRAKGRPVSLPHVWLASDCSGTPCVPRPGCQVLGGWHTCRGRREESHQGPCVPPLAMPGGAWVLWPLLGPWSRHCPQGGSVPSPDLALPARSQVPEDRIPWWHQQFAKVQTSGLGGGSSRGGRGGIGLPRLGALKASAPALGLQAQILVCPPLPRALRSIRATSNSRPCT